MPTTNSSVEVMRLEPLSPFASAAAPKTKPKRTPCTRRTVIAPAAKASALRTPPSPRSRNSARMIHTGSNAAPTINGSKLDDYRTHSRSPTKSVPLGV